MALATSRRAVLDPCVGVLGGRFGCGGVPGVREMGEVRRACWDSLPPNHVWMVHLPLHTSFEPQMTSWKKRRASEREREESFNICVFEKCACFIPTPSLPFCFILIGSDPDSYIQTRPCTVGSAFMFDACVVLFIKIKQKLMDPTTRRTEQRVNVIIKTHRSKKGFQQNHIAAEFWIQ